MDFSLGLWPHRCACVCWPGVARRQVTFFCFAKRKSPKKRRPDGPGPSASLQATCGARRKWGRALTRFAQTVARPDPLSAALLGPARRVRRRNADTHPGRRGRAKRVLAGARSRTRIRSRLHHPSGCAEERRARRIRTGDCLSRRRVRARPRLDRAPQVALSASEGSQTAGSPFSLLTFFLATQKESELLPGNPRLVGKPRTAEAKKARQAPPERCRWFANMDPGSGLPRT